jgi:hypothetical protein
MRIKKLCNYFYKLALVDTKLTNPLDLPINPANKLEEDKKAKELAKQKEEQEKLLKTRNTKESAQQKAQKNGWTIVELQKTPMTTSGTYSAVKNQVINFLGITENVDVITEIFLGQLVVETGLHAANNYNVGNIMAHDKPNQFWKGKVIVLHAHEFTASKEKYWLFSLFRAYDNFNDGIGDWLLFMKNRIPAAIEKAKQWIEARGIEKSSVHLAHVENVPAEILATAPTAPTTQTPQTDQLNAPAADDPRGNYVLRRREGAEGRGAVLHRFSAPNNRAAIEAAREWTTAQGIERRTVWLDHISGVPPQILNAAPIRATLGEPRSAFTEPRSSSIPEVPLDIAQNFQEPPASWDSGSPIETEPQNFPAARNEFTGEWKVVDGLNREVYRFGGIGNSQSDANRVAREWAQRTGFDGNLEVYPVMR